MEDIPLALPFGKSFNKVLSFSFITGSINFINQSSFIFVMDKISVILLKFSKFNSGNNLTSLMIFLLMVLRCSGLDRSWAFLISEKMFVASLRLLKVGVWPLFIIICLFVCLIFFVNINFLL